MEFSSKITLYDFLTMFVPGAIIQTFIVDIPSGGALLFWSISCFIIGMIYHRFIEWVCNCLGLRNSPKALLAAWKDFHNRLESTTETEKEYYRAYYYCFREKALGSVSILEAHQAFVRNILPLCIILLVLLCCDDRCSPACQLIKEVFPCSCAVGIGLLLVSVALFFLYNSLQKKISYLIYEGNHYFGDEEQRDKNNKNE